MAKLKDSVKKRWVEALRSGRYEQWRGRLRERNQYCCLGVLCDIAGGGKWEIGSCGQGEYYLRNDQELYGYLGGGLVELLFEDSTGWEGAEVYMIAMNDDGVPFEEIATWIEANL